MGSLQGKAQKGVGFERCESNVEEPLRYHSDSIKLKPKVCNIISPSKPEVIISRTFVSPTKAAVRYR